MIDQGLHADRALLEQTGLTTDDLVRLTRFKWRYVGAAIDPDRGDHLAFARYLARSGVFRREEWCS